MAKHVIEDQKKSDYFGQKTNTSCLSTNIYVAMPFKTGIQKQKPKLQRQWFRLYLQCIKLKYFELKGNFYTTKYFI